MQQSDAINFLSWFLNVSHDYLSKNSKNKSSVISQSFQGRLRIETFTVLKESDKMNIIDKIVEDEGIMYKYELKEQNF